MSDHDGIRGTNRHLIAAGQVQGSAVHGPAGERPGSVKVVMIDKPSERIALAVLNFGGCPGFGDRYPPLPRGEVALRYGVGRRRRRGLLPAVGGLKPE